MTSLKAKLAYLAVYGAEKVYLNVQDEDGDFRQFEITRDQLAGFVADGARALALKPAPPITRDGEL